jgi:hypothetical protein
VRSSLVLIAGGAALVLACSDGGTGPTPGPGDGSRLAAQFERLADSVDAGGYSPAADALRHAAEIARLTGHASPVTLTIDGATRNFLAVAEQIDFPNLECSWPSDSGSIQPGDTIVVPPADSTGVVPPDGGGGGVMPPDSTVVLPPPGEPPPPPECHVVGTYSMRTLIAWEPEHMAEVVRIVADVGSNAVAPGVPDVMTGLPSTVAADPSGPPTAPPDSAPGGGGGGAGGYPGFMGEYLVRDVGSWWAVEGNQSNDLVSTSGACTQDRATFDWAEFSCEAASFRFEFGMTVEPLRYGRLTGVVDPPTSPEGNHTLSLGSSSVDGVRLEVVAWTPPPLPPEPGPGPDPVPVDSGVVRMSFRP